MDDEKPCKESDSLPLMIVAFSMTSSDESFGKTYGCDFKIAILSNKNVSMSAYLVPYLPTFPMVTAAKIILARPNSVDEMPAIWPEGRQNGFTSTGK